MKRGFSFCLIILFLFLNLEAGNSKADDKLLFAVQAMNVAKARQAIKQGANVNGRDDDGWPFFITAVNGENMEMTELFLKRGVKIDIAGPDGKTALMHAIIAKNQRLINLLLRRRASLKSKDNSGKTVLMYAAEAENEVIVNRALAAKIDVMAKDKKGLRALNYAMAGRNKKIIKKLGQYEIKPYDFTLAVETGDAVKARILLRQGIDPNLKNEAGEPPLFVAIRNNDRIMLKLLLEYNADVNFRNKKNYTILMYCLDSGKIKLAQELLKGGASADFNFQYKEGKTALMIAIISKERRFINSVIKFKQNVNIQDDYGNTALIYAAGMGMGDLVEKLLKKGADKSIGRKDGRTAYDIAKAKNFNYVMSLLD